MFALTNIYVLTERGVGRLLENPTVRGLMTEYTTAAKETQYADDRTRDTLRLYFRLQPCGPGAALQPINVFRDAEKAELQRLRISLKHFITFGLLCGFLRRIHEYPVVVPLAAVPSGGPPGDAGVVLADFGEGTKVELNGLLCLDYIMCLCKRPRSATLDLLHAAAAGAQGQLELMLR
eukprot:GHVU01048140.1.p1 GENE.GHVU01048140.1~~GHVU01048140.1.p1  ORF type:complete len:178 (+),score=46.04 GHVU01048140.1:539-1072(+)